ncbi:LTA synthase family protein [Helicobacter sp. T3_23-1059]
MQFAFVDPSVGLSDKLNLHKYGFLYDTRVVAIALFVYVAFVYVLKPISFWLKNHKIFFRICNAYAFILGFVCALFGIVNFYYYEMYKTKIDIFIFGIKDDNTKEILGIIFRDYPVGILVAVVFVIAFGYGVVNAKILQKKILVRLPYFLLANLVLLCVLFIGARGSFSSFPLGEKDSNISTFASINALNPNPILAFSWALSQYKNDSNYDIGDKESFYREFLALQESMFYLKSTTPKSNIATHLPKPHIVINLMESFGSGALSLDYSFGGINGLIDSNTTNDTIRLDVLGALREHLTSSFAQTKNRQDFIFWRFFSSNNGTAPSFFDLYFLSPTINLSTGKAQKIKLAHTPLSVLQNNGYEVIFITSSSGSWVNISQYIKNQGIDKIYDMPHLIAKYKDATAHQNSFGINDEYIYKDIIEVLNHATKPTAIFTLTTSNHPPFITPSEFDEINAKHLSSEVQNVFNQNAKTKKVLGSLLYSNNAFGEFLSELKHSKVANNVVVFATGDHHLRDLRAFATRYNALNFATPLYIYIPTSLQDSLKSSGRAINYDALRVGSHKDIFPTIFELFLDNAEYISLGGRNMLGKANEREFGINASIWADGAGIYYNDSMFRWKYHTEAKDLKALLEVQNNIEQIPQEKRDFRQKYERLRQMQFLDRLNFHKE